jgi:hypothetical protein
VKAFATDLHGCSRILARVDFFSVADAENKHNQTIIFQRTDEAVISDAVFPELAESPLQSFSDFSRVVEWGDPLVEKFENAVRYGFIKLVEFSLCRWVEFNRPLLD